MDGASDPPALGAHLLAQVVDTLVWPLMLLQPDGHLLHGNRQALRVLQRKQAFALCAKGLLQAVHKPRRKAFADALPQAACGSPVLLHWPGDTACTLVIQALASPPAEPVLLLATTPSIVDHPDHAIDSTSFALGHGLSPAESRVLQRLAQGDSPAQAAQVLGVTVATVRSQSMAIRHKTGHSSLAQLISAVAHGSPLSAIASNAPTSSPANRQTDLADPACKNLGLPLRALLDHLDQGLLLADADGQVLYGNPTALQTLQDLHALHRDGRRLLTQRWSGAAALNDALSRAACGQRSTVELGQAGLRLQVTALPLPGAGPGDAPPCSVAVLLVLGRRPDRILPQLQWFARGMSLTPSETRVLEGLCQGLRPAALSQQLSVALSTVRTHIGSMRTKAGAGSIRQLVHQVAAMPPLRPQATPCGAAPHSLHARKADAARPRRARP